MPSLRDTPPSLSLEILRSEHSSRYRRWVLVAVVTSLLGYTASSLSFTIRRSFGAALWTGDPLVVTANLGALFAWARGHSRTAAFVALAAALIDLHYSLLVLEMPTLANMGFVVPSFVLTAGLLLGGRVALWLAGALSLSVPLMLWTASLRRAGTGLEDGAIVHFLVVLEAVLLATAALLWAFLRTFSEVLAEHQASEARSRELLSQLQHAQKLEALGLLAGGVAHDFNNLLAVIGGYGSLMERSADANTRDTGAQLVAATERGAKLTRQLLAFARKDIAQPKPMDLGRTLGGLMALLQPAVGERTRLRVEAEPECHIMADPARIEQVLLNLAVNARDAMPKGGSLWIRCTKARGKVRLEVEDDGVGMDETTQSRVFEPFFTTKSRHQGTGLGLSTVHGIVTESGGTIELSSRVGHGTKFTMHWPEAPFAPPPDSERVVQVEGSGRTVLVVEDNDGVRTYMERVLSERGFRVVATRSAEDALVRTEELTAPPDLVVSDVILPGLTGPELVRRLRDRWQVLPCLFVSGYIGDAALGEGFDPVTDLVRKPFTLSELLAGIEKKLPRAERSTD